MFPVEEKIDDVRRALSRGVDVVLTAPPGSGKTTCVPPALLNEPWLQGRKIVMLEPRRLAARNCASFIAKKMQVELGGLVGYQVRLERRISKATRLEIVTEGLLTNMLMDDPELSDVGLVIFDEFHERSLQCDLAYALCLEAKRALRPDLRMLVMSATLDADLVAAHLGAEIVRAEGRMYPVETKYLGDIPIGAAIERAMDETDGDVLCFLPGEAEIRRNLKPGYLPLYGSMPKEEQDRVFHRDGVRKIILATSIAETSITLEGVTAVVDAGLMRVSRFSPSTGMSSLVTLPVTMDRADQRRGRAGRVRDGVCYRLWTEGAEQSFSKNMSPEILDADLCSLVMTSIAWGAGGREDLPWLTPPPASSWDQAKGLLKLLGALGEEGRLTETGRRMAKLPMHPRLANMMLHGGSPKFAAIIEEGSRSRETDIRYVPMSPRISQLEKRFSGICSAVEEVIDPSAALAYAYPDRIAKNRGNGTFRMVSGGGAFLPEDDPMAKSPYLVCCELDGRSGDARIFRAAPITEAEIVSMFNDKLVQEPFCEWDRQNERVKAVVRTKLGELVMMEKNASAAESGEQIILALVEGVRQKGVDNLPCWDKESLQYRDRINFLWKLITAEAVIEALPPFVSGMTKWKDLERLDIKGVMDAILASEGHSRYELDTLAPVRMEVPSGSHMLIQYSGTEPTVEVRLQECFGLMETPKVAGGKVPIVMTLLSPAHRPCAVTKDLAGFWKESYQLVRKDLRGRYPKHYWPEDPFSAVATRKVRPPQS